MPENEVLVDQALLDVLEERKRQDQKWGEQNHNPFCYLVVLMEEVGELSQAALHTHFGGCAAAGLRTEAIHVAAVALAIVQCLDRGKWSWPLRGQSGTFPAGAERSGELLGDFVARMSQEASVEDLARWVYRLREDVTLARLERDDFFSRAGKLLEQIRRLEAEKP